MGFSTATCRIQDANGVQSDYQFKVPNERSNGDVTSEERLMALLEMARQGLPAGTSLVGDSFTLHEDRSERFKLTQLFSSDADVKINVTGMSKLFTPRPVARVVTLEPVNITVEASAKEVAKAPANAKIWRPEDFDDTAVTDSAGNVSTVIRFEDLPLAENSKRQTSRS